MRNRATKRERKWTRYQYWQSIPELVKYQVVTKTILFASMFVLGRVAQWAIESTGRVAITSGDFLFLLTSWQGWLLIVLGLTWLFLYTALDLNTKIWYCSQIMQGKKAPVMEAVRFGLAGIRRFLSPSGIVVVLYIALIAPIVGFGLSISLTTELRIPSFIASVISSTPVYRTLYTVVVIVFTIIGVLHAFVLHVVLLDGMGVKEARALSRHMVWHNLGNFILQNVVFAIRCVGLVIVVIVASAVPAAIVFTAQGPRPLLLAFTLLGGMVSSFATFLIDPFFVLKLTQLYYWYKRGERVEIPVRERRRHPVVAMASVAVVVLCGLFGWVVDLGFDELFPLEVEARVIAHRGGGNDGPENTLAGLETAIVEGAYGSEIDIQRTRDGHYIVNHDTTFERVAGDDREPSELTLEEVRELRVKGSDERIPTLEEMLDAARGRIVLFVELKGDTADQQMADDAVKAILERDMVGDVVLISLKYDLVDYIESTYPEIQTGYLTWLAYGDTASLHCDYLGLEAESATPSAIDSSHRQGKLVMVWTPNTVDEQEHFLCGDADAIITDNVAQSNEVIVDLEERTDLERMLDKLPYIF